MPDIWMDVDTALSEVPVNVMPLIDDTDFKTREVAITYDQGGMDLVWNFVTTAGASTQTAVTPTTAGVYDWTNQGDGMYTIEIPASAGGSINNDTEGFGWFSGFCTGVLPWRGPIIGFRAAALNNLLIDSAYSATRGLAGTALPDAAADAPGGLAISDAGGLDIDAKLANTNEVTAARMAALTDWINGGRLDLILDIIAADVVNIDGDAMRGTDGANTTVPDAAGTTASLITAHDTSIDSALATIAGYLDTEIAAILAAVDTEVAAIKAKTDNLPASPAAVGSEMTLEDDAITAAKYDETTAHPLTTAMQKAGSTIITGTVSHDNTAATTTVFYSDDITEATADHYNGRIVIFTSGALLGQATDITDYALDTGEGKFTVTALTEAPADNVTFVIV